jgi:hypothetical protein
MENFTWDAVPSQRQRKTEKYDYPVVTMAALAKAGAGRKFSFNKAAQELLNIQGEDRVSFGFNSDRTIVAVRKAEGDAGFKLTKTCTFSDKKIFEFISKTLELSNDVENEFKINSEIPNVYTLVRILEETSVEEAYSNEEAEEMKVVVASEKTETSHSVEVTEEVADTIGNVNYPEVDDTKLNVTSSEDVSNQW